MQRSRIKKVSKAAAEYKRLELKFNEASLPELDKKFSDFFVFFLGKAKQNSEK